MSSCIKYSKIKQSSLGSCVINKEQKKQLYTETILKADHHTVVEPKICLLVKRAEICI